MMTSRQRALARLIPFVAFSVIAISALHAIATPVPASADPPLGPLSAEGGEIPLTRNGILTKTREQLCPVS